MHARKDGQNPAKSSTLEGATKHNARDQVGKLDRGLVKMVLGWWEGVGKRHLLSAYSASKLRSPQEACAQNTLNGEDF